eukprot:2434994-Rhodomonas_salina.1
MQLCIETQADCLAGASKQDQDGGTCAQRVLRNARGRYRLVPSGSVYVLSKCAMIHDLMICNANKRYSLADIPSCIRPCHSFNLPLAHSLILARAICRSYCSLIVLCLTCLLQYLIPQPLHRRNEPIHTDGPNLERMALGAVQVAAKLLCDCLDDVAFRPHHVFELIRHRPSS